MPDERRGVTSVVAEGGAYHASCNVCSYVSGAFVLEAAAFHTACTHVIEHHMRFLVGRPQS